MLLRPIKKIISEPHQKYLAFCRHYLKKCPDCLCAVCQHDSLCSQQCKNETFCLTCLSNIFEDETSRLRIYNCENITYSYVLRFLNRYASEIYWILKKNINFIRTTAITVVSIGCGPSTELFGFEKVLHSEQPTRELNYFGFDKNPLWNNCQNFIKSIFADNQYCKVNYSNSFFDENNSLLQNVDFLILNYLLSDIHKHSNGDKIQRDRDVLSYLNNVILPIFSKMKRESYLLVNDTNSCYMGRNAIELWANSVNQLSMSIRKGYFDYPGRYFRQHFNSNDRQETSNQLQFTAPVSQLAIYSNYTINITECRSSYVLIQKR